MAAIPELHVNLSKRTELRKSVFPLNPSTSLGRTVVPSGRHCGDGSHYLLVNDFLIFRVVVENDLIRKPNKGERLINAPRLGGRWWRMILFENQTKEVLSDE